MVTVKPLEDDKFVTKCSAENLNCSSICSQEVPVYCFGTKSIINNSDSEEEQSLLDLLLLAQWEDRLWKDYFSYDVTATEIKVVSGRKKFFVQLNRRQNVDCVQDPEVHGRGIHGHDGIKHRDELLFCISSGDKACSEIVPSAAVPKGSVLVFANVNPIEYGHIILVPQGFTSVYKVLDARSLEMAARIAVEMNNSSFRLFHDCSGTVNYHLYFQACYFPDLLPVEFMSVDSLFSDSLGRIHMSAVAEYPIKTLVFESSCNLKIMVDVLADICACLLEKNIPYNLLISDCGKRIFLFLQMQTLSTSSSLSAWECGGYFLLRSKSEFDQVTEADLLSRLGTFSLDDEAFAAVKRICCSISRKYVTGT